MLKVVAPTFKCDRTVHICLIEDVFDKLNHIFKELHGTHYVFILSGKKKNRIKFSIFARESTVNPHVMSPIGFVAKRNDV